MLVRVLLLMPLAHLIFFEDSFLSFCVDTIYTDTKLVLFLFYFEVKDNGEVELTRSVFLPKTKFFSRSKPDRTVSRNGKGISVIKSKYASSILTVFELMPNRFYPMAKSRNHPSPRYVSHGMLDPRCEAILEYHASLTRYHCERSLDNFNSWNPTQLPTW